MTLYEPPWNWRHLGKNVRIFEHCTILKPEVISLGVACVSMLCAGLKVGWAWLSGRMSMLAAAPSSISGVVTFPLVPIRGAVSTW